MNSLNNSAAAQDAAYRQRYSRHIQLPQYGARGQQRVDNSRVLIVGIGGLGSALSMYLAASGVGELVLCDYDIVELSNLQRQIVHGTDQIGNLKVDSAAHRLRILNPLVRTIPLGWSLDVDELAEQVAAAAVVVDASDNFSTRFLLNRLCWQYVTPLVFGAAIRMEGQLSVFDPRQPDSPCYRCLYHCDDETEGEACAQVGVLAPLLGIIGSIQATETLKLLLGIGGSLVGRLLLVDALHLELRTLTLPKDPACPVCAAAAVPNQTTATPFVGD